MNIGKIFRYLAGTFCALAFIGVVSLFIFTSPSTFTLVNLSSDTVAVSAKWSNDVIELGQLEPDEAYRFEVRDEAGMTFVVEYQSGKTMETESYYFSTDIDLLTTIYDDEVTTRYVFET